MRSSDKQQDGKSTRTWNDTMRPDALTLAKAVPLNFPCSTWTGFGATIEPHEFTGWVDESVSWKTDCYIGDWSPLIKVRVRGPQAQAFFEYLSTNFWPNFHPGQAKHAIFCHDHGYIVGEGLVLMLDKDDFLFTSGPGTLWMAFQAEHGRKKFNATVEYVTEDWYLLQIQGPRSVQLLDELTDKGVRDIEFMHWKELSINGNNFRCLRQGVSGELGFELWGPMSEAKSVYSAILDHGKNHNIRQLGARTKMVNHVEAGFATPTADFIPAVDFDNDELIHFRAWSKERGFDFDKLMSGASGSYGKDPKSYYFTPFDLNWGRLVNLNHDFVGRDALAKLKKSPPNQLVTLEWNNEDVQDVYGSLFTDTPYEYMEMPRGLLGNVMGSTILLNKERIGVAVSRCYSYWFKEMISLGIVEKKHADPGTSVEVVWGSEGSNQKIIRAIVRPVPYKEDKRRHSIAK